MKMLLHMCCGPCSCYPVKYLRELGYEPEGYFYNPNIQPYREFKHRLSTAQEFAVKVGLTLHVDERYQLREFLQQALNAADRCKMCYAMRLYQTAEFARANGYKYYSTTLLVSPYQKHDIIRAVGEKIGRQLGVEFIYDDFRRGWDVGVQLSKDLDLYRQPYCGCIFSEQERYDKNFQQKVKDE